MSFCPFRSTPEKEVECKPDCALFCKSDEGNTCSLHVLAEESKEQTRQSINTASALMNKCY